MQNINRYAKAHHLTRSVFLAWAAMAEIQKSARVVWMEPNEVRYDRSNDAPDFEKHYPGYSLWWIAYQLIYLTG